MIKRDHRTGSRATRVWLGSALVIGTAMLAAPVGAAPSHARQQPLGAPTHLQVAVALECADGPCRAEDGAYDVVAVFRDNASDEDGFEYQIDSRVGGSFTVAGAPAPGSGGVVASAPYPATPGDVFCVRVRAFSGDARGTSSRAACQKLTADGVLRAR